MTTAAKSVYSLCDFDKPSVKIDILPLQSQELSLSNASPEEGIEKGIVFKIIDGPQENMELIYLIIRLVDIPVLWRYSSNKVSKDDFPQRRIPVITLITGLSLNVINWLR